MNWKKAVTRVLGYFWNNLFTDTLFIQGICFLHSLFGKLSEMRHSNWLSGLIPASTEAEQDNPPFIIYIDVMSIHEETASYYDAISGSKALGTKADNPGWVAYCKEEIPQPYMLKDHIFKSKRALFAKYDFEYRNKKFLFYMDPNTLGFDTIKIIDADGELKVYYRLFGYARRDTVISDPVTAFYSQDLNPYADVVWDMHQNGATVKNVKKLLAGTSGSVVCEKAGTVADVWVEQGYNCMLVDDKVYMSAAAANYETGASVNSGDILFGDLRVYSNGDEPDAEDAPGLRVRTDAGELVAQNNETTVTPEDGVLILPLEGDPAVLNAYKEICKRNTADMNCPYIDVPTTVNSFLFITNVLRRGKSVVVRTVPSDLRGFGAAVNCIRRCACAAGMINVYVRAESDAADVHSSFVATAGMAAVAVDATITIQAECAEAKIMI